MHTGIFDDYVYDFDFIKDFYGFDFKKDDMTASKRNSDGDPNTIDLVEGPNGVFMSRAEANQRLLEAR